MNSYPTKTIRTTLQKIPGVSQLQNQGSAFNIDSRNSVVCIATDLHDCDYKSNRKDIQSTELQDAFPISKYDTAFNFVI